MADNQSSHPFTGAIQKIFSSLRYSIYVHQLLLAEKNESARRSSLTLIDTILVHDIVKLKFNIMMRVPSTFTAIATKRLLANAKATPAAFAMRMMGSAPSVKVRNDIFSRHLGYGFQLNNFLAFQYVLIMCIDCSKCKLK